MKIIICGAGRVGLSIAGYLSQQDNHITIIDSDINLIKNVVNNFDISGIHGHASQPDILKRAGADNADVIIAVTDKDEVNMVACQVAHSVFGMSKKIARIRQREYRDPAWSDLYSRNHMPIDVIISPEEEIAETILNRMVVPGTTNDISQFDNNMHVFGIIATQSNGLSDVQVKNLYYNLRHLEFKILLVIRDNEAHIPKEDFLIKETDEIYFAVGRSHLFDFLSNLGIEKNNNGPMIICGGGEIGRFLGESIIANNNLYAKNLVMIEQDIERARFLNRHLDQALILNGSALEDTILTEANIQNCSVFVSVMNNNENNILAAVIAKKMGAQYTLALSTNRLYNQLLPDRFIDAIINPEIITVSKVLRYLRKGRIISVNTLRQGHAEIIEAEVSNSCSIVNIPFQEINLPQNVDILAIYSKSKGRVIFPKADSIIENGDIVSVLSTSKDITQVEKLFSFSIDLF
jgi:trk system potassium uptake protein TrkA